MRLAHHGSSNRPVLAYLLVLLLNLYPTSTLASEQSEDILNPLRVLVVGDSITHCNEGDFTWRYRIWQWFQSQPTTTTTTTSETQQEQQQQQNLTIDFVGPYLGTAEPDLPSPPPRPRLYSLPKEDPPLRINGKYATDDFTNSNHFAISGRAVAQVKDTIQPVVAEFSPDLILVLLGFNDLAFGFGNASQTLENTRALIENSRSARPNVAFVVGNVVQRTWTGREDLVKLTDEYNGLLREAVAGWSLEGSPVVFAPVREEYDCGPQYTDNCPAAHDGLHPSELGEYQIARAFSRALVSGLQIGSTPLEVPATIPPRPLPKPENFQIYSSTIGVTAIWDKVFGAYTYDAEYRINGSDTNPPLHFSPTNVRANRWDTHWAVPKDTYDLRVRPIAGNRKGEWTDWQTAVTTPDTASAPEDVIVKATATGIDLNWTIPFGSSATLFNFYYWDVDVNCTNMLLGPTAAFEGNSGHIDGLVVGHQYNLAVESWNDAGAGLPRNVASAIVGSPETVAVPRDSVCPPKESIGAPPSTDPINPDDPQPPPKSSL